MTPSNDFPPAPQIPRASAARIAATLVALAIVWTTTMLVHRAIQSHLDESLYIPACNTACGTIRAKHSSHRAGGKNNRGGLKCYCNGPAPYDWAWKHADVSRGSLGDLALHWGGDMAVVLLLFAIGGVAVISIGNPAIADGLRRRKKKG